MLPLAPAAVPCYSFPDACCTLYWSACHALTSVTQQSNPFLSCVAEARLSAMHSIGRPSIYRPRNSFVLQLQQGQGQAAPQAPVNYFNLPPTGPGAGPRYPSMDPSAMGSHAQREARDSNDGDSQDHKRMRRNGGPGEANGPGGPGGAGMPPPGWQPVPPMFFPGMPPGMGPGRPPFPGGSLPPGMQPQPQQVAGGGRGRS